MMMIKRQKRTSDDDAKKKQQLMDLPVDTLVDILLRLPAKTVGRFKLVSKTLSNVVNNISFSTLHTRSLIMRAASKIASSASSSSSAADDHEVPRLMCCTRDRHSVTLQSMIYEHNRNTLTKGTYGITIPSSSSHDYVLFVFYNLFGLGNKDGNCVLVNGLGERGVLRLPECSFTSHRVEGPDVYSCYQFGMGYDDITNTYKVVCASFITYVANHQPKSMLAHVHVLGTNSWRQISAPPPFELSWIIEQPVSTNGAVHWWTGSSIYSNQYKIISFDSRKEEFYCTAIPPELIAQNLKNNSSNLCMKLFSIRGCLAILKTSVSQSGSDVMIREMEIWVMKDFEDKKLEWVKYYSSYRKKDPFPPAIYGYPGEWKHGIFVTDHYYYKPSGYVLFIDFRSGSINRVEKMFGGNYLLGMCSFPERLISLSHYGNLDTR